jgi:hypothetical protein
VVKKQTRLSSLHFNLPHKCQVIALLFRVSDYLLIERTIYLSLAFEVSPKSTLSVTIDDSTCLHADVPTMGTPRRRAVIFMCVCFFFHMKIS